MKIRWFAAGIAAVLITGGAATVAQRVITQKTRGVLPAQNDSAHADSRVLSIPGPLVTSAPVFSEPAASPHPPQLPVEDRAEPIPDPLTLAESNPPLPPAIDEIPPSLPPSPMVTEPIAEPTAIVDAGPSPATINDPPINDPAINLVAERSDSTNPVTSRPAPVLADPVETVESFVERNRQEAESNIQALGTEAENLKARLAKVEAALVRWQSFSRALHANQTDDQASPPASSEATPPPAKANWKRISEPAQRSTESIPVAPAAEPTKKVSGSAAPSAVFIEEPAQGPPPPALPPESDPSPPVGSPPGDTLPPSAEPKPTDLPPPTVETKPTDLPSPVAEPELPIEPPSGVALPLPLS